MIRNTKLGMIYRVLFAAAIAASAVGLTIYTDACRETAGRAAAMCMERILPSLFPFLVLSNLVIGMGYTRPLGRVMAPVMRRLFNVGGACAGPFLMGILGGYPIGAKSAINLYENRQCSKTECQRLLAFCNNSGPAFILGVVGSGVFSSTGAGLLLYAAHVAASVTVGILFRFYRRRETIAAAPILYESVKPAKVFTDSVTRALASVGNISAFVIFFAVAADLLFSSGVLPALVNAIAWLLSPFDIARGSIERVLIGFLEMTSGLTSLSDVSASLGTRLSMAAFMLGWAGISVHCQVLSFIGTSGLSVLPYLAGKMLHGILSAVYIRIFLSASAPNIPAFADPGTIAPSDPIKVFLGSLGVCAAILLVFLFTHFYQKIHSRI